MWSHEVSPLTEAASGPKGIKTLCNNALEISFKELKHMVSADMLLSYLYWKITFTVQNESCDKQLGYVISKNNKPICLLLNNIEQATM